MRTYGCGVPRRVRAIPYKGNDIGGGDYRTDYGFEGTTGSYATSPYLRGGMGAQDANHVLEVLPRSRTASGHTPYRLCAYATS